MLFRILIGCVVPKSGYIDDVNKYHKGLVSNISHKTNTNLPNLVLEHIRSFIINSRLGMIKKTLYSRLITVVLMCTTLIRSQEKVRGEVKDEHLVYAISLVFNINNIIKMMLIVANNGIKPNDEFHKLTSHNRGSQDIIFMDWDSHSLVFQEDSKGVIQECIKMYHSSQEMSPVCIPLPRASREFENKRKREIMVTIFVEEEEEDENTNEYEASLILRKKQKENPSYEPIHSFVNINSVSGNDW